MGQGRVEDSGSWESAALCPSHISKVSERQVEREMWQGWRRPAERVPVTPRGEQPVSCRGGRTRQRRGDQAWSRKAIGQKRGHRRPLLTWHPRGHLGCGAGTGVRTLWMLVWWLYVDALHWAAPPGRCPPSTPSPHLSLGPWLGPGGARDRSPPLGAAAPRLPAEEQLGSLIEQRVGIMGSFRTIGHVSEPNPNEKVISSNKHSREPGTRSVRGLTATPRGGAPSHLHFC